MSGTNGRCQNWGHLKENTPFNEIFPDRRVPLRSIFSIIPREQGSPPCYIIDADFLTQEQISSLAQQLFELWRPECESIEQARDYIRQGLPLKTDWFNGAGSSSPALLFSLMDDEGFQDKDQEDIDVYGYSPDDYYFSADEDDED
jgi:hypothetical protein